MAKENSTAHNNEIAGAFKACFEAFDSIQGIAKAIAKGESDHVALANAIDHIAGDLANYTDGMREQIQQNGISH